MKSKILAYSLFLSILVMASCTKSSEPAPPQEEEPQVEGVINDGTIWTIANADLPSENLRNSYEKMEFSVDDQNNYKWKWYSKSGMDLLFEGYIFHEKTEFEHSSGSGIWDISINVLTINGESYPGGWYGIYAYADAEHLLLNVEPDVVNWGDHPEASKGLGSGSNAEESIYKFSR